MTILVEEITVAIGVTRNIGNFESVRIDISNRAKLPEPVEVGSKAYKMAHKELVASVEEMVQRTENQLLPDEDAPKGKG